MALIYETKSFVLESHERPEIDRLEGGHVKITSKRKVSDRTELNAEEAIELVRFTIVSGIAMKRMMAKIGITLGRINYQENGNWNPVFHVHLYGRALDAKIQKYGDPIINGHKEGYEKLNEEDISLFKAEIEKLFKEDRFSDKEWGIVSKEA